MNLFEIRESVTKNLATYGLELILRKDSPINVPVNLWLPGELLNIEELQDATFYISTFENTGLFNEYEKYITGLGFTYKGKYGSDANQYTIKTQIGEYVTENRFFLKNGILRDGDVRGQRVFDDSKKKIICELTTDVVIYRSKDDCISEVLG